MNRIERIKIKNDINYAINQTHRTVNFNDSTVRIKNEYIDNHSCIVCGFILKDDIGIKCIKCDKYICKLDSPDVIINYYSNFV